MSAESETILTANPDVRASAVISITLAVVTMSLNNKYITWTPDSDCQYGRGIEVGLVTGRFFGLKVKPLEMTNLTRH